MKALFKDFIRLLVMATPATLFLYALYAMGLISLDGLQYAIAFVLLWCMFIISSMIIKGEIK